MAEVNQVQISNLGGLNTNAPVDQIEDNEFSVLENMLVRRGSLQKRVGCNTRQDLSMESERYVTMGAAEITSSRVSYIFFMDYSGTRLITTLVGSYVVNDSDFLVLSSNVSDITSNLLSSSEGVYLVYTQDSSGDHFLAKIVPFDVGSETTTLTGAFVHKPHWIFEHQDRMWAVMMASGVGSIEGSAVVFSDPGDYTTTPTDITGNNVVFLPNFFCYEAVPLEDKVLFFGEKGIWVLYTQGSPRNWVLKQLDANITCPPVRESTARITNDDRKGFQQVTLKWKGLVYFLANDGFYVTDGVDIKRLSDKVQNFMRLTTDVTSTFIGPDQKFLTEFSGVCLYDHLNDEIMVKAVYNDNKAPKYLVYSISNQTWSEFVFGIAAPEDALTNTSEIEALIDAVNRPYPYAFESMFYIFPIASGITSYVPGIHFGSNSHLTEQNIIYSVRASARPESEYFYADGGLGDIANSTAFLSKIRTKAFDFGFKGVNKKISKNYLTVKRVNEHNAQIEPDDYPLPLVVSRIVNGTPLTDIELTLDYEMRYLKLAGPGYFVEYELEISDEDNKAFWELQAFSFDIIAKPEMLETGGIGTAGQLV